MAQAYIGMKEKFARKSYNAGKVKIYSKEEIALINSKLQETSKLNKE